MRQTITVVLVVLLMSLGYAQGPPITTETPIMLGLEGSGIRTFGKFISKENAKIYVHPLAIPFNISPTFQIGGIMPFKFITPNESSTTGGLADMILFAKYQLYKKDEVAETFRIVAKVAQTFPTANQSNMPALGAGVYQTYFGLIAGKITTKKGLYGDIGYNVTSGGASDNFAYNLSLGIPLLAHQYPQKQLNAFIEWNGNYLIDPKVHTLFLSPGVQLIPGRRILFETSFQIPVLQSNIPMNKTEFTFLFGTRFLIS